MCVAMRRDNYPADISQTAPAIPAHSILFLAPITLTNLLPHEISYTVGSENGRIPPGSSADLHTSNNNEHLEINIQLEGYPGAGTVRKNNLCTIT